MDYASARALAAELARRLRFVGGRGRAPRTPRRYPVTVVGGLRREKPTAKDVDLLVIVPTLARRQAVLAPPKRGDRVWTLREKSGGDRHLTLRVGLRGPTREARNTPRGAPVDIFFALPAERPFALFHYTGSRDYNIRTRAHAKRLGYLLNQYGLYRLGPGKMRRPARGIRTERDLARRLGVTYRPPRLRSN